MFSKHGRQTCLSLNVKISPINLVYTNIWNLAVHTLRDNIVADFLLICNQHVIALSPGLTVIYEQARWKYLSRYRASLFSITPTKITVLSIFIEMPLQRNINRSIKHTSSRPLSRKGCIKVRLTFTLTQNFRPFLNVMALYRRSPDTFISQFLYTKTLSGIDLASEQ